MFQSRDKLNQATAASIESTISNWGIHCERYEVLKIEPPSEIRKSMQLEAEAERLKRRDIILSQASRESEVNIADGQRQSAILKAQGEAEVCKKQ